MKPTCSNVLDFEQYVKESTENGELEDQYKLLSHGREGHKTNLLDVEESLGLNENKNDIENETNILLPYCTNIKVFDFEQYVLESIENGELEYQHKMLSLEPTKSSEVGRLPANISKNRYMEMIPYDHTRVVLAKVNGDENSDYINANYIEGHYVPKAYIATQGPTESTVYDFWRMIWQESVRYIVTLTNVFEDGVKKTEQYWASDYNSLVFNDIIVQHISTEIYADYVCRMFNVICDNKTRIVSQYHFLSWPDHSVPRDPQSLVPFLREIQKIPLTSESPIVVHCSAGAGRTGTLILCDICLRIAAREDSVDVPKNLVKLREQRSYRMVSRTAQYKLVHLLMLEWLRDKKFKEFHHSVYDDKFHHSVCGDPSMSSEKQSNSC